MKLFKLISFYLISLAVLGSALYFSPFPFIDIGQYDYVALIFLLLIYIISTCYPIKVQGTYITLIFIINVTTFLLFGFLAELLITQLGLLISTFLKQQSYQTRQIQMHFLLMWVSLLGATAYFTVQFLVQHHDHMLSSLLPVIAYVLGCAISYVLILTWMRWIEGLKHPITWNRMKWTLTYSLFAIPMGMLMQLAYDSKYGLYGLIMVTIPTLLIFTILRLSNYIQHAIQQMEIIHDLTAEFSAELDLDKILHSLVESMKKLYPYDTCYIFMKDEDSHTLKPLIFDSPYSYDEKEMMSLRLLWNQGLTGQVAQTGKATYINSEVAFYYIPELPRLVNWNKSILCVPLKLQDKVMGVITLGSFKENAFTKKDLILIETLANYAITSITNAKAYQQAEKRALVDELTDLLNYRGFMMSLEEQMEKVDQSKGSLALLLMDIDHFKQVNDQFGHLMGNRVLEHLSRILQDHVRKNDLVCRYGGEEFTVILPDTTEKEALGIAERIRQAIASNPIRIQDDLDTGKELYIRSTVSIGLAIYPQHAEDSLSLIRHADRAMYIGAKKAGRNRVAVYDAS